MHKIITIAQQKGGTGKTTVAAHLAVAFSQRGKRVTAIDIDPQGSFSRWHELREEKFGKDYTGINFITAQGWKLPNVIASVKHLSDIIIIDSPPHTQTDTKTAVRLADMVIIPAQASPTDLWATKDTVELINAERIPHRILLNRVVHNSKLNSKIGDDYSNIMQSQLRNRVSYASSMIDGRAVTETYPSSAGAKEVRDLLAEVENLIMPEEKLENRPKEIQDIIEQEPANDTIGLVVA